jgi:hypothetical protein
MDYLTRSARFSGSQRPVSWIQEPSKFAAPVERTYPNPVFKEPREPKLIGLRSDVGPMFPGILYCVPGILTCSIGMTMLLTALSPDPER